MGGLLRLVHPFPSALDAIAAASLAAIAGAQGPRVILLGGVMLALQLSIGVTNDVADVRADEAAGRAKPIPMGLVALGPARLLAVALGAAGLASAALAGPATLGLAIAGYLTGIVYDLRLKATAWSWVPFAVGIPILPLFAWVGATGGAPPAILGLALMGMPAGAALALTNSLADMERDRGVGIRTIAGRLGWVRTIETAAALHGSVAAVAVVWSIAAGGMGWGSALTILGSAALAIGLLLAGLGRAGRGWEIQAVGVALLATGLVLALGSHPGA